MANDQFKLNKQAIFSLFGQTFGSRLLTLLGACCDAITFNFSVTCSGDEKLPYTVTESVTYSISIPGITTLIVNVYAAPVETGYQVPLQSQAIMVKDIVAGKPIVTFSGNVSGTPGKTVWLYITDNHGNSAEPVKFTLPAC